jgi:hypothetical protein
MGFMSQATDRAAEVAKGTATHTRAGMIDLAAQLLRLYNDMRQARTRAFDGMLDHIGLRRRSSAVWPVAWFAVGAAAAGTAVLLLAPSSGKDTRGRAASWVAKEAKLVAKRVRGNGAMAAESNNGVTGP